MATPSLAHPAYPSTDRSGDLEHVSSVAARVLRGQALYREHAEDFVYRNGAWLVASDAVPGRAYEVRLGPVERCECGHYRHRGVVCKHVYAARIAHSKSRICSCCGHRVLGRFVTEVTEDDALLSWFVGDVLCADCIRAGYWA